MVLSVLCVFRAQETYGITQSWREDSVEPWETYRYTLNMTLEVTALSL